MFERIIERLREEGLFAAIDLHNNTGRNPHYGCVNYPGGDFLNLAALFGRTVVYFARPRGVASMAFAALAPAVTLECGHPGDEAGIRHAMEFIDAVMHLSRFPGHPPDPRSIDVFHTVALVRVRPGLRVSLAADADVMLETDLDRMNFRILPSGAPLVRQARPNLDALIAIDENGGDVTRHYLLEDGMDSRSRRPMVPSMLTLDTRVIAKDCLCYLMEPLDIASAGKAS